MSLTTPVDRLYDESSSIIEALGGGEPSLAAAAGDSFRKTLILASASYFEYRVSTCVVDFVHERSGGNALVVGIVKNKAVSRQYHTWFDWKKPNANAFFGLFGPEFKQAMEDSVKGSDELHDSIHAFMEVGSIRNTMVHQDFASFSLDKTLDEIYALYKQALFFVDGLPSFLRK